MKTKVRIFILHMIAVVVPFSLAQSTAKVVTCLPNGTTLRSFVAEWDELNLRVIRINNDSYTDTISTISEKSSKGNIETRTTVMIDAMQINLLQESNLRDKGKFQPEFQITIDRVAGSAIQFHWLAGRETYTCSVGRTLLPTSL